MPCATDGSSFTLCAGNGNNMTEILVSYFIFPGFLFAAAAGMIASWIDRKVTARVQWRQGPPLMQPFYEIRKLFIKETILPADGSPWLFVLAPFFYLASIVLVADILFLALMNPSLGFVGDLIVVFYLLALPAVASIMGAAASGSPFASIGASREIKLLLGYEVPLFAALLVPVIKSGSISLGDIIIYQQSYGALAGSFSGIIALIVGIMVVQAKMGLVPFDAAEAETEIAGGCQVEYSGPLLALWKLGKMIMLVVGPLFLVIMFWATGGWLILTLKYVALLTVAILIRNTNPRLRIDQAMRFFWGPMFIAALVAVIAAWMGY